MLYTYYTSNWSLQKINDLEDIILEIIQNKHRERRIKIKGEQSITSFEITSMVLTYV